MSDWRIGLTGAEFAAIVMLGHTKRAHVDEQLCVGPDCASLRLLAEHPDDWASLSADEFAAWVRAGGGS